MTEDELTPGYAEFELGGKTWRLEPTVRTTRSFSLFATRPRAKKPIPAPAASLNTEMPRNGEVVIDFNRAHNPPCAFTSFATCPLPPRQNTIGTAIPAGEKKSGKH